MSAVTDRLQGLVRERPGRRGGCAGAPQRTPLTPRLAPKTSRRPTLGDLVAGAWEGLCAADAADCPVCGGTMLSRRGAGPAAGAAGAAPPAGAAGATGVSGACEDCGSELS
jgi:hypothetical protein